jgi:hypothetical protein
MGQLTNFSEKKILDHVLKVASYSPPATVYLGLSTADPTADGSGWVNPTYTGYAMKAITFAAAGSVAGRRIDQTGAVTFDPCTVGSSTVGWWGLWDASTISGNNLLAYGALSVSKTIVVGNTPSVATGQVTVSFTAGAIFTGLANTILDWLFRAQALAQPNHVHIALSTTTPTDAEGNITPPSGNNYSQATQDSWHAATGNPEAALNNGTITMPTPSGSWGLITYAVLYLYYTTGPVSTAAFYGTVPNQTPDNGDTVEWLDSQFSVSVQ